MSGIRQYGSVIAIVASIAAVGVSGCSRSESAADDPPAAVAVEAATPAIKLTVSDPAVDGPIRRLGEIPFEHSWDLQLPSPVHMSWMSPELPKLLFFQLRNGQIHAIDSKSGKTEWVTRQLPRLMEHTPTAKRLSISGSDGDEGRTDDRLYAIAGDTLYCFDAVYGQLIYRHDLPSSGDRGFLPSTSPVFQGSLGSQRIFVGDWAGRVQALTYDEEDSVAYRLWQYNIQAVPLARPIAADDGLTYIADIEGHLHCFDIDRELRWSFNTVSRLTAPPLLRGRTAYLGSRANVLHVLNRLSGQEVARLVLDGPVTRQPMAFNGEPNSIYVWTGSGRQTTLHRVRTIPDSIEYQDTDGFPLEVERVAVQWSLGNVGRLIASTPRHLYINRPDQGDRILAVNRRTGVVEWHWDINPDRVSGDGHHQAGGPVQHLVTYQDPRDSNRSIFTVDADGYVVAYRLFGQF